MKEDAQHQPAHAEARRQTIYAEWYVTAFASGEPRSVTLHGFDRYLRSRVADTHDQHVPRLQLCGVAVLGRVELHDVGAQIGSKRRPSRTLIVAHGDDDVVGFESSVSRDDDESVAKPRQALDAQTRSHR